MDWARDGQAWPHRAHSHFIDLDGQRWHVQFWPGPQGQDTDSAGQIDRAPAVLLVHGTGASTHSFRALAPLLAAHAPVLAVDLPGHGFSADPPRQDWTLRGLAQQLAALVAHLQGGGQGSDGAVGLQRGPPKPGLRDGPLALAVGHSAGAAILAQAVLHAGLKTTALASLNGAFLPFGGVAAPLLSPLARLLYAVPGVPGLFSSRATDPAVVRRLIEGTGSSLDDAGLALYARLMRDPGHTRAALAMMAHWELQPLVRDLPRWSIPLALLAGSNDRAVPPSQARRVAALVPQATLDVLPGLGHLAHEEAPEPVAALLCQHFRVVEPA